MVTDRDLVIRYWNPWLESRAGRPAADMLGWPLLGRYPDLAERKLDRLYRRALDGQTAVLSQRLHQYLLPMPTRVGMTPVAQMLQSGRIAPLLRDGQIIGTVTAIEDVTERVQREAELQRQLAMQEALTEISRAILTLDLDECLRRIVTEMAAMLGAELGAVVLEQGETWRVGASTQPVATVGGQIDPHSVAAWVSRSRQACWVEDLQAVAGPEMLPPLNARSRSLVAAPLVIGEEIIGALVAESERVQAFGDAEQRLLTAFALHAALAIRNARLFEALAESQERFSSAFEYAAIGMALVAPDGRWLKTNRSLCELVGYTAEEMSVRSFQDLTHPDDLASDLAHKRQLLAGEIRTFQMEKRYLHRQGQTVWVLLSVSLVRDAQGHPVHFIAQIQDITARKAAEAERERLIGELQKTLAEVKILKGLIPICASCKKVRDDRGFWNQIESYISRHSEAKFSHGICPECTRKLFPDLADELEPAQSLAAATPPAGQVTPPPSTPAPGGGRSILLVITERASREAARQALEGGGFAVAAVADGLEATQALADRPGEFGLAVMERAMPLMDGVTTLYVLRRLQANLPVVFLTDGGDMAIPPEVRPNVQASLTRPFTNEQLLATVKHATAPSGPLPSS
jgi:PAS domain S-box-containing protein